MTLFADAILLQIWLYTQIPSLIKKYYTLFRVLRWEFASVYNC